MSSVFQFKTNPNNPKISRYRSLKIKEWNQIYQAAAAAAAAKLLQSCPTLCDPIDSTRLPRPWDSPGKSTGVGCHFLLQYILTKKS